MAANEPTVRKVVNAFAKTLGYVQTHSAQEIAAKMPADQVLQQVCDRWASCDSPRLLEHSRGRAKQIARAVQWAVRHRRLARPICRRS